MRPELSKIVADLATRGGREISIDDLGEAFGVMPVSAADVDEVMAALEARGVSVSAPEGARGERSLRAVVAAARDLRGEQGRTATVAEIAARSGLSEADVRHALALAKVIQR